MDYDDDLAPFALPHPDHHPADIAARVLELPEHAHLKDGEANIAWLMRRYDKVKAGRQVLGTCYMPTVQGDLRDMFMWMVESLFGSMPDFLIVLDARYWGEATELEREILVYHELCHAAQAVDKYGEPRFDKETGLPCWALKGHDVEEFTSVVRRYGAWNHELQHFINAAQAHDT